MDNSFLETLPTSPGVYKMLDEEKNIIYVGKVIKNFNLPILIGLVQTLVVSILSIIGAILFEEIKIDGILKQTYLI